MPQPAALLDPIQAKKLSQQTLAEYINTSGSKTGWWSNFPTYIISLLKAWYGETIHELGNDSGYCWLPKITGDHSHLVTSYAMLDGKVKGYFLFGQNPAAGSTNSRMQRRALEQLDWMVVRDLYEVESAAFWHKGPEPVDPSQIKTEVFLLPAAASTEKEGTFTNTQRLLQWR